MKITVLGASGATGQEITRQALERGHIVTAISRNPQKIAVPDHDRLIRIAADVRDTQAIAKALAGSQIVMSSLGISKDEKPGIITAGAQAVVRANPVSIIWMGALGTGESAGPAGFIARTLLQTFMRAEVVDKVNAETLVLQAGGTVFACGTLSDKPLSSARRTVTLDAVPRHFFPISVSRATVASMMLDEAEKQLKARRIVVPLDR